MRKLTGEKRRELLRRAAELGSLDELTDMMFAKAREAGYQVRLRFVMPKKPKTEEAKP